MSWDAIGDAIYRAFKQASNLPDDRVIWKHQNFNAPDQEYLTISLGSMLTIGQDYVQTFTDDNRPPGQEIEIAVRGTRETTLELEIFTQSNIVVQSTAALARLTSVVARLALPSVREILFAQGISPYDPGPARWIPDIPGVAFRGRAVCSIACYMPLPTESEFAGYIARVIGEVTSESPSGSVTSSFDTKIVTG